MDMSPNVVPRDVVVNATPADPPADEPSDERLKLPGFGKPVIRQSSNKGFIHALDELKEFQSFGVTLRERRMMDFVGQVTDKPEWERKVFDQDIVSRWREEAKTASAEGLEGDIYMSDDMFDFCISELRQKAEEARDKGFVRVLDAEIDVVKSDSNVPVSVCESLRRCVRALEDVPEMDKDWHPGSDQQVLDLLHPSLFPVMYGTTRALPHGTVPLNDCTAYIGKGELTDTFVAESADEPSLWGSYQWLPSDVAWTESGVEIKSYVNNLHPHRHGELYRVLESFVEAAVPLWDECLVKDARDGRRIKISEASYEDYYVPADDEYTGDKSDEDWEWSEEYEDWWRSHRVLTWPEPAGFDEWVGEAEAREATDLREQSPDGLQVIFKLANIHLSPEKPKYAGGSWHVEGALNERICATALFYYDEENTTPSHLAFRGQLNVEELTMVPAQSEYEPLEAWMGVEQDGPAVQNLGQVLTRPGRMLAFPNALQHQVQPFELDDATRPGHRKILAMFLVDPHVRVLSSANVPPQRRDWWAPEVRKIRPFSELPVEIFDLIIGAVDYFPVSWDSALTIRQQLMDDRRWKSDVQTDHMHDATFSFCEH